MVLHWHLPILAYNIGFHGMEPSEESGPDTGLGERGEEGAIMRTEEEQKLGMKVRLYHWLYKNKGF